MAEILTQSEIDNSKERLVDFTDQNGQFIDAYKRLNVEKTATEEEIREAATSLMRLFHPKNASDIATVEMNEQIYDDLKEALWILTDRREEYDKIYDKKMKENEYTPEPAPAPASATGKLTEEEIERLLAGNSMQEPNVNLSFEGYEPFAEMSEDEFKQKATLENCSTLLNIRGFTTAEDLMTAFDKRVEEYRVLETDSPELKAKKQDFLFKASLANEFLYEALELNEIAYNTETMNIPGPVSTNSFYTEDGTFIDLYAILGIPTTEDAKTVGLHQYYIQAKSKCRIIYHRDTKMDLDNKKRELFGIELAYRILTNIRDIYNLKYDEEKTHKNEESKKETKQDLYYETAAISVHDFYDVFGNIHDFYSLLGIGPWVDDETIKSAYKRAMEPEKVTDLDSTDSKVRKLNRQNLLTLAYRVLLEMREDYEKELDKNRIEDYIASIIHDIRFDTTPLTVDSFYNNGEFIDYYDILAAEPNYTEEMIFDRLSKIVRENMPQLFDNAADANRKNQIINMAREACYVLTKHKDMYDIEYQKNKEKNMNTENPFSAPFGAPTPAPVNPEQEKIERRNRTLIESMPFMRNEQLYYNGQLLDFYEAFRIEQNATQAEIDEAFDRAIECTLPKQGDTLEDIMMKKTHADNVGFAYRLLSTPTTRDAYDQIYNTAKSNAQVNPVPPVQPTAPAEGAPVPPIPPVQPTAPAGGAPVPPVPPVQPTAPTEEDYAAAERAAQEAFDRLEDARIAAAKNLADAEAARKAAESAAAEQEAERAKTAAEDEKAKKKAAAEKAKEERKEARKKKREAKKAEREAKKAKKKAEKIAKTKKRRQVLVKDRKGGKLLAPFRFVGEHWKGTIAVVGAVATVTVGAFALKHYLSNVDLSNNNPDPKPSQSDTVLPPSQDAIDTSKDDIANSWGSLGTGYSKDDIDQLVEGIQGGTSSLDADAMDNMIESAISEAITPAINNILLGEQAFEVKPIEISSLLAETDPAMDAIMDMEDCLNGMLTDSGKLTDYASDALENEIRVVVLGETVNGFNMNTSSPAAKIIWSRLAIGINGLAGTLGEDFTVTVDGVTYSHSEINNAAIFGVIINSAKSELGIASNTMTK